MTARDVIAHAQTTSPVRNRYEQADAILAALAQDGWRVVRLDERSPYYRPTIPSDEPLYVVTEEATP